MFGNDNQDDNNTVNSQNDDLTAPTGNDQTADSSSDNGNVVTPDSSFAQSNSGSPSDNNVIDPANDDSSDDNIDTPIGDDTDINDNNAEDTDTTAPAVGATSADDNKSDLISIKQDALTQLSPLIKHLDQPPEDKFRTTMMMIQASDDQSLIKSAFESAKQITDDKVRAQALLDIINEINYFTQQNS